MARKEYARSQCPSTERLDQLLPLGVGVLYNPSLEACLDVHAEACDYVEMIPDMAWTDHGRHATPRFTELGRWREATERIADRMPLVARDIGLSLGTEAWSDPGYLAQLVAWQRRHQPVWHGVRLPFVQMRAGDGEMRKAAAPLPARYDEALVATIAARIDEVHSESPLPFLIGNKVDFVALPEQEMSEPRLLNALAERTGCGLLLDVHNLCANAKSHRFDPFEFIDALDLERVVEVHIAGGGELGAWYRDSHSGPCPPPVWQLLDYVVPRASRLCGITFEFHDSYFPALGDSGVRVQLERARRAWDTATHVTAGQAHGDVGPRI